MSLSLLPTRYIVLLEDGKMLFPDPLNIFERYVVNLTADAFNRILGCSRHMGPTLLA